MKSFALILSVWLGLLFPSVGLAQNPPVQSAPANGSTNLGISVLLDWANLSGASGYDYQVYEGTTLAASNTNGPIAGSSVRLTLDYGTTYKWRCRGRVLPQNNPWSGYWTFSTEPVPRPQQLSPANGAITGGASTTLSWSSVGVADGYDYELWDGGTMIGGYGVTYSGGPYRSTSVQFSLVYGKTYTWRVRARVLPQNNPWTGSWSFTTPPPPMPTLTAPANGSTFNSDSVTLAWSSVGEADGYDFEVTDGGSVVAGYGINYSGGPYRGTSVTLALPRGRTYQCRVRARVLPQNNPWTPATTFSLQMAAPRAPVITNIQPGAVVPHEIGQIVLQPVSGASFELRLTRLNDLVEVYGATGVISNTVSIPRLSAGANFRVAARAANASGAGPWTTVEFSAAGLATPTGISFTSLDADETGELIANGVEGAESYEISITGPTSGTRIFQSATPTLVFDLEEDPGSTVVGSIVARATFARSAPATTHSTVKRPRENSDKTQWAPTIATAEGARVSFTVKKLSKEKVSVQQHRFISRKFKVGSPFSVTEAADKMSVTVSIETPLAAHSGLYRLVWKNSKGETAIRQFFFRVNLTTPPPALAFGAIPDGATDLFSGFQFVGLTKASDNAFKTFNSWFHSGDYKNFNLEVQCLPVTFYNPLKMPKINVHPLDAVHRLIESIYPRGVAADQLREGKLRVEIDLFFAHRTNSKDKETEYGFAPTLGAKKTYWIHKGINYKEFSPVDPDDPNSPSDTIDLTPKGGIHFDETMRRADMVADFFAAIATRTELQGKLDFVLCIDLEDELGASGQSDSAKLSDMKTAYEAVTERLAARGVGLGYAFPVYLRRVYDDQTKNRSRVEGRMSKENHDNPVKNIGTESKPIWAFDSSKIAGLLDRAEADDDPLTAGDGYSNDGDGNVENFFSDKEIRQVFGLGKTASSTDRHSGIIQEFLTRGISIKLWRPSMNGSGGAPRERGKLNPFNESALLKDFLDAVQSQRPNARAARGFARDAPGEASGMPHFSLLHTTMPEGSQPAPLPAVISDGVSGLAISISGDYCRLVPSSLFSYGAMLESSLDLQSWSPVTYLSPNTHEVSLVLPAASAGFLRLAGEAIRPGIPASPSATLDDGTVSVEWNSPAGAEARFFIVERRVIGGAWMTAESLYTWEADDTGRVGWSDRAAPDGTWVEYRIRACNSAGDSGPSASTQVWVPHRPGAVAQVAITLGGTNGLTPLITWAADPLGIATEIIVERASGTESEGFTRIAAVPPASIFEEESDLQSGTYRYRICGRNTAGEGPWSTLLTASVR